MVVLSRSLLMNDVWIRPPKSDGLPRGPAPCVLPPKRIEQSKRNSFGSSGSRGRGGRSRGGRGGGNGSQAGGKSS